MSALGGILVPTILSVARRAHVFSVVLPILMRTLSDRLRLLSLEVLEAQLLLGDILLGLLIA